MQVLRRALDLFRRRVAHRELARARRQEALGQLAEATVSYLEAGSQTDACRLYVLRADASADPSERLLLLAQAIAVAPDDEAYKLRKRRARLAFEQAAAAELNLRPSELVELGKELEEVGELTVAAEAYQMGGDAEGRIRALVAAGEIERLEQVLEAEVKNAQAERYRRDLVEQIRDLDRQGKRREALELGQRLELGEQLALLGAIEQSKLAGPRVRLELDGIEREYVFGDTVIVGRSGAHIELFSPSISRAHVCIQSSPHGPEVVDLGSRNGTTVGGLRLDAPLLVSGPTTLVLGGDVSLQIAPLAERGVRLRVAGSELYAPLGPLVIGAWRVELARDYWLELCVSDKPAHLGGLLVTGRVQLCRGDAVREEHGQEPRLKVPR